MEIQDTEFVWRYAICDAKPTATSDTSMSSAQQDLQPIAESTAISGDMFVSVISSVHSTKCQFQQAVILLKLVLSITAESILTEGSELQHQQEETVELDLLSQSAEI